MKAEGITPPGGVFSTPMSIYILGAPLFGRRSNPFTGGDTILGTT